MHINYHFFKILLPKVSEKLIGLSLSTCFSQNKDELILGFSSSESSFYIRVNCAPQFTHLSFPEDYARSRKNSVDLFEELIDQTVEKISLIPFERAFYIHFSGGDNLLFKMHGNRSNLLLIRDRQILKRFRHDIAEETIIEADQLARNYELTEARYEALDRNLKKWLPTLGKIPYAYIKENGDDSWAAISGMLKQIELGIVYISRYHEEIVLSLLPIGEEIAQYEDPIAAANAFFSHKMRGLGFEGEKHQWKKYLETQLKKAASYIDKNTVKLSEIQEGVQPGQIADIIMANLHQIPAGVSEVDLFDFYHDREITIKLKKELSPQKSAEQYYRKEKNKKIEINTLEQSILQKLTQAENWKEQLDALEQISDAKALKSWLKESGLQRTQTEEADILPYRAFVVEGFQVWVGKNAKSNDILTLKHAKKEDLWLHAKDVSGSHVVIKQQAGKNFPKPVIEKAAGLAAYYSKLKHESLATVIVTPAKFVRKVKGTPAGAVRVEKEDTLLVHPVKPEDL